MTQTANNQPLVTTREANWIWNRNEVIFMGNLGRDPEMSYTPSGKLVTKFSLAVWQGKDKDSMWLNVTCWEKLAEEINEVARKGTCVEVRGRLTQRKYEGKYYHDVVADSIEIIERNTSKVGRSSSRSSQSTNTNEAPF